MTEKRYDWCANDYDVWDSKNERRIEYMDVVDKLNELDQDTQRLDSYLLEDRGKLTNIDYQTDWILKELKRTNELLEHSIKVNSLMLRLFEHMLEKSDNLEQMRQSVRMEMARGLR